MERLSMFRPWISSGVTGDASIIAAISRAAPVSFMKKL
jgi:hypothetical protein